MTYQHTKNNSIIKIATLVSCASILQIVESYIPHPIPGVRLGLANMLALIGLINIGFFAAVEIAILRTLLSSFILGTFLSPAFILSFSGALSSVIVMGLFYKLFTIFPKFGVVSISVIGSLTNNITQLFIVYLLIIKHQKIFLLLPLLCISGVIMGWITGLVALDVCNKIKNLLTAKISFEEIGLSSINCISTSDYNIKSNSIMQNLSPEIKIIIGTIFCLMAIFSDEILVFVGIMSFLFFIAYLSKISIKSLFLNIRKLALFIFISFALPILFDKSGEILVSFGYLKITKFGFQTGIIYVLRIITLMSISFILVKTINFEELMIGLKKILFPLKIIRIPIERFITILIFSFNFLPVFWEKLNNYIKKQNFIKGKKIYKFISALSNLITIVYMEATNKPAT